VSIRRDASATGASEFPDARGVLLRERGEPRRSVHGTTPNPHSPLLGYDQERLAAEIPIGCRGATAVRPSPLQCHGLVLLPPFLLASVEEDLHPNDFTVILRHVEPEVRLLP